MVEFWVLGQVSEGVIFDQRDLFHHSLKEVFVEDHDG